MLDPMTPVWVALALALLLVLTVILARSRRWGAVCTRCAWRHRALTEQRAHRAATAHAHEHGHDAQLYRRGPARIGAERTR